VQDEKKPFFDIVQAALADPQHGLFLARPWREAKKEGCETVSMRMEMERAKVFRLSDDFTELAAKASLNDPGVLLNAISCARLPYDTLWLEWDEETRLNVLAGYAGPDSAMRIGLLAKRAPGTDDRFSAQVFWLHRREHPYVVEKMPPDGERRVFVSMLTLQWSTQGEIALLDVDRNVLHKAPGDVVTKAENYIIGRHYCEQWKGHEHLRACIDRMSAFVGVGTEWNIGKENMVNLLRNENSRAVKLAQGAILGIEGDVRFLVTVLALLQTKWVDKTISRPSAGVRQMRGVRSKWMDIHTCVITAPKERILAGYKRMVGIGAMRRRHDVMGHFCERHGTGIMGCVHEYVENGAGQEVCKLCAHTRWWRKAHHRGSEKVGVVQKDYEVRAP
jgi:hypothetical protein